MEYVISFLEGIITFISPCLLPMLPVYISYFAGEKGHPLKNALGFVTGFTIVFVALGAFAGGIGQLLIRYQTQVNWVAGGFIILLGLKYLGVLKIPIKLSIKGRRKKAPLKELNFLGAVVFGITFGVLWTPCVSTFLGVALLRASTTGSMGQGMAMLFLYALGLGIPFVISAVLIDRLKHVFEFIQRHYRTINIIAGCMLLVVGLLVATGLFGRYLALFATNF